MDVRTLCMLGRHCTAEPCSSLSLANLEENFRVGGKLAYKPLEFKLTKLEVHWWGASRKGVKSGQAALTAAGFRRVHCCP